MADVSVEDAFAKAEEECGNDHVSEKNDNEELQAEELAAKEAELERKITLMNNVHSSGTQSASGPNLFGLLDLLAEDLPSYSGPYTMKSVWIPNEVVFKKDLEDGFIFSKGQLDHGMWVNTVEKNDGGGLQTEQLFEFLAACPEVKVTYESAQQIELPTTVVDKTARSIQKRFRWSDIPAFATIILRDQERGEGHGTSLVRKVAELLSKSGGDTVFLDCVNTVLGHPQRVENEIPGYLWGVKVFTALTTRSTKDQIISDMTAKFKKKKKCKCSVLENMQQLCPAPNPAVPVSLDFSPPSHKVEGLTYYPAHLLTAYRAEVQSGSKQLRDVPHQYINVIVGSPRSEEEIVSLLSKQFWGLQYCVNYDKPASDELPDLKHCRCVLMDVHGCLSDEEIQQVTSKTAKHLMKALPSSIVYDFSASTLMDKYLFYRAYGAPITRRCAPHAKVKARFVLVNSLDEIDQLEQKGKRSGFGKLLGRGIKFPNEKAGQLKQKFDDRFSQFLM